MTIVQYFSLQAAVWVGMNSGTIPHYHWSQQQNQPGLQHQTSDVRRPKNHRSAFGRFTRNSRRQYLQGLSLLILLSFLSLLTYGHSKWWNTSLWGKVHNSMLKSMALQRWAHSAQRRNPLQITEMTKQATSASNNILSPLNFRKQKLKTVWN